MRSRHLNGIVANQEFVFLDLVSRLRSPLHISASNRRRWQGGPTMEYREYSEEAQRCQRRREPARYATNFRYRTLARSRIILISCRLYQTQKQKRRRDARRSQGNHTPHIGSLHAHATGARPIGILRTKCRTSRVRAEARTHWKFAVLTKVIAGLNVILCT